MATRTSAGLLMYRFRAGALEVLLGHPGGPFWAKRDAGSWSIPKGELDPGEDELLGAIREFEEETGQRVAGRFFPLTPVRQSGGKLVRAWAVEGDLDVAAVSSNTFVIEWPPRSGKSVEFPELDRVEWFTVDEACRRVLKTQVPLLQELTELLRDGQS